LSDGSVELISEDIAHSPINLAQIRQVHFDNNQLLIGDSDVNEIIAVNTETGERSYYLPSFGIGEGLNLVAARHIAVNKSKTTAYILDDGSNAPERLIELDLATGNRKLLYDFHNMYFVNALVLDEEKGRLFTVLANTIGVFDIATQQYEELHSYVWQGENHVNGLVFDKAGNRLLFNSSPGIISSLDLATNAVSTAYKTMEGDDVTISGSIAMTLDTKRNQLLIKSYLEGKLFTLDLASGKRELLLESCVDEKNFDQLSRDVFTELDYNQETDSVVLNGDFRLIKVPIETATCTLTPSATFSPLDVWQMTNDTVLELSFNSLHLVDLKTRQSITLSR
jgi:hypothetical protein